MTLNELAIKYGTDKKIPDGIKCLNGFYGHGYTIYYEEILRGREIKNMLEIGVSKGASIRMWREYYPKANVVGVDIKKIKMGCVLCGDATDTEFLQTLTNVKYDLIIDDGSHIKTDQLTTFNYLFDYVVSGGLYVIEDVFNSIDLAHNDIKEIKVFNSMTKYTRTIYIIHKK